jgi:hypothetical protein
MIPKQYLSTYVWEDMSHIFPFTKEEKVVDLMIDYFKKY